MVTRKLLILCLIIIPILLTGLFYYFFREGTVAYQALGIDSNLQYLFKSEVVNALPSFAHVYSFSLATWFVNGQKNGLFSVLWWVMINVAFEFGQVLSWDQLQSVPDVLASYFSNGSFSEFDLVAVLLGGLAAYMTVYKINEA